MEVDTRTSLINESVMNSKRSLWLRKTGLFYKVREQIKEPRPNVVLRLTKIHFRPVALNVLKLAGFTVFFLFIGCFQWM